MHERNSRAPCPFLPADPERATRGMKCRGQFSASADTVVGVMTSDEAILASRVSRLVVCDKPHFEGVGNRLEVFFDTGQRACHVEDRKSTRLNSSHTVISYAVFCLKKKKK